MDPLKKNPFLVQHSGVQISMLHGPLLRRKFTNCKKKKIDSREPARTAQAHVTR